VVGTSLQVNGKTFLLGLGGLAVTNGRRGGQNEPLH